MERLFGELMAVSLAAVHVERNGWNLTVRRTWDWSKPGAPETEIYEHLTRGELLDVLDAIRAQLELGTEY